MRFLRDNSLSIFFLVIFLASLAGQAIAGHGSFNHDQLLHHGDPISNGSLPHDVVVRVDVAENWQSEYLQFILYVFGTVWLLQRGSPESKPFDQAGPRVRRRSADRCRPVRGSPRGRRPADGAPRSPATGFSWG